MAPLPTTTRALCLLFTDLVDSTQWIERLGDGAAADLLAEHDRVARELLELHAGREIDRTDGFFLLFDDVGRAAAFALGYQEALGPLSLMARVGIHVAPVMLRENEAPAIARGAKPLG
jgi:class 3 adenylate cyclase